MNKLSYKMILTIVSVTLIVGDLIMFAMSPSVSTARMLNIFAAAFLTATTLAFNRKELKELWDKIFNKDDDFKGGHFG